MIKIRNIRKTFGENTILRGIDLDVGKGQVVVILGPSGSGKTTFLRCLNALAMPEDGQIEFDNERPLKIDFSKKTTSMTSWRCARKSGMVFQQYNLFPHKTALENVMEGPVAVQGKPAAQAREEALKLLEKSAWAIRLTSTPTSFPAVSSSVWRLHAVWRWSRASCCLTSRLLRLTLKWSAKY